MAVEKKRAKKKRGRPATGKRPVIAIRVHEKLYEDICASAADHRFTISEEAEHRIQLSFEWETMRLEMQRLTGTIEGVEELIGNWGFRKHYIDGKTVVWTPPGQPESRLSISLDLLGLKTQMAELVQAIERFGEPKK
jgi:hypothetical protein